MDGIKSNQSAGAVSAEFQAPFGLEKVEPITPDY